MLRTYFHTKLLIFAILFTTAVFVFTHLPQEIMPSQFEKDGVDKLEHVLAYGVITFLFLISLRTSPTILTALLLSLAVSVIGIFDELTQRFMNRNASVTDLMADFVGILAALFFFAVRRRWFLRTTP